MGRVKELVQITVAMLRALGHQARFTWSMQPLPFRRRSSAKAKSLGNGKGKGKAKNGTPMDHHSASRDKKPHKKKRRSLPADARAGAEDHDLKEAIALSLRVTSSQPVAAGDAGPVIVCGSSSDEVQLQDTPPTLPKRSRKRTKTSAPRATAGTSPLREAVPNGISSNEYAVPLHEVGAQDSPAIDYWIELFHDDQWVAVDGISGDIGKAGDAEAKATSPVHYVVAVDGNNNIRDVTERYASSWLTTTAKQRIDSDWWQETLRPYKGTIISEQDIDESTLLEKHHQNKSMPTSLATFKAHKLYAIERHLHKNQIIHPKTPVGMASQSHIINHDALQATSGFEMYFCYEYLTPAPLVHDRALVLGV